MTGRYYGKDHTEFFYPPKGILQPIPRLSELVLTIIGCTGTFPTPADWIEIRQALAKDAKDLKIRALADSPGGFTFNEVVKKLKELKPPYDSNEYVVKWDVPWSEHIKTVTEIRSALDSTKGLTKQMLTTPFI
ncbi:hypothetical protein LCGC14_1766830 [marine sediment metagenome]|uniref:Uncharacterized protein n=1 Tax=marine sediment metagenome TaxID=412755 RepID=A0A0F9JE87_9ZZZZ